MSDYATTLAKRLSAAMQNNIEVAKKCNPLSIAWDELSRCNDTMIYNLVLEQDMINEVDAEDNNDYECEGCKCQARIRNAVLRKSTFLKKKIATAIKYIDNKNPLFIDGKTLPRIKQILTEELEENSHE